MWDIPPAELSHKTQPTPAPTSYLSSTQPTNYQPATYDVLHYLSLKFFFFLEAYQRECRDAYQAASAFD
jgi:hypothetical protein